MPGQRCMCGRRASALQDLREKVMTTVVFSVRPISTATMMRGLSTGGARLREGCERCAEANMMMWSARAP